MRLSWENTGNFNPGSRFSSRIASDEIKSNILPSILAIDRPALLEFMASQNFTFGFLNSDPAQISKGTTKLQSNQPFGTGGMFQNRKKSGVSDTLKKAQGTPNEGYRKSVSSNYHNLMDKDYIGNQLNMINNHIRLQSFVKLKDSQTVSMDMYYLGPLLHAYGTSWNTKMIPPETGIYLEHFSHGALGLLHIIPKINSFMSSATNLPVEKLILPKRKEGLKLTVLFDLDETLAHCKMTEKEGEERESEVEVSIRPYTYQVLKDLKTVFEVGLFTSSAKSYADTVISRFDPKDEIFDFRLYKTNCADIGDHIFVKDLSIIPERSQDTVLIVDNNFYCYALQLTQGIPIIPFTGDPSDTELLKLSFYLKFLSNCAEPASFNTRYFGHDILLQQIKDSLTNLPSLMLERILEVALGMNSQTSQTAAFKANKV